MPNFTASRPHPNTFYYGAYVYGRTEDVYFVKTGGLRKQAVIIENPGTGMFSSRTNYNIVLSPEIQIQQNADNAQQKEQIASKASKDAEESVAQNRN